MVSESFPRAGAYPHLLALRDVESQDGVGYDAGTMAPWDTGAETTSGVRGMSLPFSFGVPRPIGVHSDRNHFEIISSISKAKWEAGEAGLCS